MNKNVKKDDTSIMTYSTVSHTRNNAESKKDRLLKDLDYERVEYTHNKNQASENNMLNNYLIDIQNCEEQIKKFQIFGYISLIFFFILFFAKACLEIKENNAIVYYYLLVPAIVSVINFAISINFFIRMKILMGEAEDKMLNMKESEGKISFTDFLMYLSANLISLLIIIFLILLAVKLETNKERFFLHLVNIPIFISIGIMTFYVVFILPALLSNKFYWGILLIFSWIINSLLFFIFATLKFDKLFNISYIELFLPLFIALFIHFMYALNEVIFCKNNIILKVLFALAIMLFLTATVYTSILLEEKDYKDKMVCVLLYTIAYFVLAVERLINLFDGLKNNKEESEFDDSEKEEMSAL